jgi:hypothetical protein
MRGFTGWTGLRKFKIIGIRSFLTKKITAI